MKKLIAKDSPLAEITLRRYEKPESLKGRALTRKLCLSLGLLQPGDSRDIIVDVLLVLLREKKDLSSEQIKELVIQQRERNKLELKGIASSNIRRQLKRLKDIHIIENKANIYRLTENSTLSEIFREKVKKFTLEPILTRLDEYITKVDEEFKK